MMSTKYRLAAVALAAALTGIPATVGASSESGTAADENPRITLCKVLRENALTALRQEEIAFGALYDADASISGTPSYELQEAHLALMKEIADEKAAVHERYRECVEKATPKG